MSEEDKEFHAKYKADRAKANEYSKEWRDANKARNEDIIRRREACGDVPEGDRELLAKYEAYRERKNECNREYRRVDTAECNEQRASPCSQSLITSNSEQGRKGRSFFD